MSKRMLLIGVIILVLSVSFAQVPRTMEYSGKLTDPFGIGINGLHNLRFRIFDVDTGGAWLWGEFHSGVPLEHGLFSVILGKIVPINLAFDKPYWLEIEVDGIALIPRVGLTSGPYAFRALFADSIIGGGDDGDWMRTGNLIYPTYSTDSVGIGTMFPSAKLDVSGDARIDGDLEVTGQIDPIAIIYQPQAIPPLPAVEGKVYYNATFKELMVYDSTSWVSLGGGAGGGFQKLRANASLWLRDSVTFISGANILMTQMNDSITIAAVGGAGDSDWNVVGDDMHAYPFGNVGIGTTTPQAKLEIVESDSTTPFNVVVSGSPRLIVKNEGNVGIGTLFPTARLYVADDDSTDIFRAVKSGSTKFIVDNDGHVGIATANPTCKLHINNTYGFIKADQSEGEIFEAHYEGGGVGQALKASFGASTYALLGYDCPSGTYAGYFDGKVYIDGKLGVGTLDPQHGVHIVGGSQLATVLIAPDTFANGDSKILLGEDENFECGMGIKYEGDDNYLFIYGDDSSTVHSNLLTISRDDGLIGIGTADSEAKLHIRGGTTYDPFIAKSNGQTRLIVKNNGYVGIGVDDPQARLDVFNKILVSDSDGDPIVEIGAGLDYAEGFDVSNKDNIESGMVLVIDPENPGMLVQSNRAYDSKVAGIIAGAKELKSGVRLGSKNEFDYDVALAGRVYCYVDATHEGIEPGDLLTTSDTPGYAMKVTDHVRAYGAVLGKAMESLEKGRKGQILVLVTLQ